MQEDQEEQRALFEQPLQKASNQRSPGTTKGETGAREAELSGQETTAPEGDGQKVWRASPARAGERRRRKATETEDRSRDWSPQAAVEPGREGSGSGKASGR